jgi:hypothetical protein
MMEQFSALYPTGTVRYSQTSYLELTTAVEVHRIDFLQKVAAALKRGTGGTVAYYTDHPALLYYNGPITALTFPKNTGAPAAFLEAYEECLRRRTLGWRAFLPTWSGIGYERGWLQQGYHYTIYLPDWLAEEIAALSAVHGVETNSLSRQELLHSHCFVPNPLQLPPPFKALFIGQNYVIARDFRVSTLR